MSNHIQEAFPYLRVRNANAAIEFYKLAFGAIEQFRLSEPNGRVGHAELKFGSYTVMVSDEYPEYGIYGPESGRSTGSAIHLHVNDVDIVTSQAVAVGATLTMQPANQFHGERSSKVMDPLAMNGTWARESRTFRTKKCNADSLQCSSKSDLLQSLTPKR